MSDPLKLDLGCGTGKAGPEWTGVDVDPTCKPDRLVDLVMVPWPWESSTVDEIRASHYIEHLPPTCRCCRNMKDTLVEFYEECYRVLKPGGILTVTWPSVRSERAFMDPYHRRFIGREHVLYMSAEGRKSLGVGQYGIKCNFELLGISGHPDEAHALAPEDYVLPENQEQYNTHWNVIHEYEAVLKAVK